jgi:hypothetical protein
MDRLGLSDADWDRISGLIIGRPDQKGGLKIRMIKRLDAPVAA